MPSNCVHIYKSVLNNIGGTVQIDTLDLTNGLTVEMKSSVFNARGVWTIISFTDGINVDSGTVGSITIIAPTGFTAGTPYLDGNTIKVVLG
jgi:hypothetical protein